MLRNMWRAAALDVEFYNTVEHDASYTAQAFAVVVVVQLLAGVGGALLAPSRFLSVIVAAVIGGLVSWVLWSAVTWFVGTKLFGGTADYGEMLRVLGFAQSPMVLGVIPFLGLIGAIWALVAGVVAIREGLDVSTGAAIGTVVIGWLLVLVLRIVLLLIF